MRENSHNKHELTCIGSVYHYQMSGCHHSTKDFALKQQDPKYPTINSCDIVIDFGDSIFVLPENFLHYIDDVAAIGFSWIPPADFISIIKRGYQHLKEGEEPKKLTYLGYLTKREGKIVDTYPPYSHELKPVQVSNKIELDKLTLKLLIAYYKAALKIKKLDAH